MKKWYVGILFASSVMLLVLGYCVMKNPVTESYRASPVYFNTTNPLEWISSTGPPAVQHPDNGSQVVSAETIALNLFAKRNLSKEEIQSLNTWNLMKHLISHEQALPSAVEAIKEGGIAWNSLMTSVDEERLNRYENSSRRGNEKQCPHFLKKMNDTELNDMGFRLRAPCGLTQGSSITIIGIPDGLLGNFRIELTGEPLPGEPDPPVILHYNVRLHGDKITEDPVIVQNTWTVAHDWGDEERCPSPDPEKNNKS